MKNAFARQCEKCPHRDARDSNTAAVSTLSGHNTNKTIYCQNINALLRHQEKVVEYFSNGYTIYIYCLRELIIFLIVKIKKINLAVNQTSCNTYLRIFCSTFHSFFRSNELVTLDF